MESSSYTLDAEVIEGVLECLRSLWKGGCPDLNVAAMVALLGNLRRAAKSRLLRKVFTVNQDAKKVCPTNTKIKDTNSALKG